MTWKDDVAAQLGPIRSTDSTPGGSINQAYRVTLQSGERVFVKTKRSPPPTMYAAEAADLELLARGPLRVPAVRGTGESFLALEWLDLGAEYSDEDFGRCLAQLHQTEQADGPYFGGRENFLATLPQSGFSSSLIKLYCDDRLLPVIQRLDSEHLRSTLRERLDVLYGRAHLFGPAERPALLHGDLWSGNVSGCAGAPVIFDPACYWGHREIDLAMLQLFGSISSRFVDAYTEVWPLDPAWRERTTLWQLYPIAVHAVLFGGGYVRQLTAAFDSVLA